MKLVHARQVRLCVGELPLALGLHPGLVHAWLHPLPNVRVQPDDVATNSPTIARYASVRGTPAPPFLTSRIRS